MVVAAVVARARAAVTAELVGRFRWEAAKGFGLAEPRRVAIAVPRNRLREFRGRRSWARVPGRVEPPTPTAARMPYRRGTRRPLPEREHRLGDLAGRCIGDRRGGRLEDEQPRPGDRVRDRLAVADGEERIAAAVDDERRNPDGGQALAPA